MKSDSSTAILHELENFRQMGSVLYIAAHPDDENTMLLAYLARGRNYRTAYLSLTRGDGGQNLIGNEFGEKLGVARTQELLAARGIDGAQQFFSRAIDFGFSKSYLETLKVWNKEEVLSDIVRVIREFKPDVIITRFSPIPGGTHGHHTASVVLAMEAFKLSGDAKAFPEQHLQPWQPKRIFWNVSTFQADKVTNKDILKINVDGTDPVTGETLLELAEKSRSMHKTQGFDTFKLPGTKGQPRTESFQLLDGAVADKDILEGIDTSWNRIPGGEEIAKLANDIIDHFDLKAPASNVPALLKLRSQLNNLKIDDPIIEEKKLQLDSILQSCLALKVETTVSPIDVVPGESMKLHHCATINSNIPVRWLAVRYPLIKKEVSKNINLESGKAESWDSVETLPITAPLTQPWWLRAESTAGMFSTEDSKLIGTAENEPSFPIENIFEVDGQKLIIADEPVQFKTDSSDNKIRYRLNVIPPVSLHFTSETALFSPGSGRSVEIEITAWRTHSKGTLQLEAPDGWKISPDQQPFNLAKIGQKVKLNFTITAPQQLTAAKIIASAKVNGRNYHNQRQEVIYHHIPPQLLQPPAILKAVVFNLNIRGHKIGYLPGAGDSLPENLKEMGYEVKILDGTNLTAEQLHGLDAVVIGVRAFNVRKNIAAALPILFTYIEDGGTVIAQYNVTAQYNQPDSLKTTKIAPYDLHISRDRVTDEKALVTFLAPENPVLNTPNKITNADFDGWVQERGLYFPDTWDEHFIPVIACNDAGEAPLKGALLVAKYGKGYFIYTGLSFFRQLPAGIPGAYRLFANLVSIGK